MPPARERDTQRPWLRAVETPTATLTSSTWDGPPPTVSVVVSTYGRKALLADLIEGLLAQDLGVDAFEVLVVDNGSEDDTWSTLVSIVQSTPLRMLAMRRETNFGPGPARNMALEPARGEFVAFTDDDCLPTTSWLTGLVDALRSGAAVVQGRIEPPAAQFERSGPWDHTIWVVQPSPFFETSNVAYPRQRLEEVGGFRTDDPFLTPEKGHPFGEDADLAWRVLSRGGERAFAHDAVVHHRVVPQPFRRWLWERRQSKGFPGLARRSPIFARWLRGGVFLTGTSAAFAGGLAATGVAIASTQWLLAAGALPWLVMRGREAWWWTRERRWRAPWVLLQFGIGDLVTLVSLVEGSVRHRRLVL